MFAALIIVLPSFSLAQAEYHHPGRALFQVQVLQGLFQLHFSRFIIQSKHSVAFSASKDTIFSLADSSG